MGNCFGSNGGRRGLVHPSRGGYKRTDQKAGSPSQIKVRMTVREYEELVSRAAATEGQRRSKGHHNAEVAQLIVDGVVNGRFEVAPDSSSEWTLPQRIDDKYGKFLGTSLEPIHED